MTIIVYLILQIFDICGINEILLSIINLKLLRVIFNFQRWFYYNITKIENIQYLILYIILLYLLFRNHSKTESIFLHNYNLTIFIILL